MIVGLLISCGIAGAATLLWQIIGSVFYDVQAARQQHQYRRHPHARRFRARPRTSVIILAPSSLSYADIICSLEALQQNTYRKTVVAVLRFGVQGRQSTAERKQLATTFPDTHYHAIKATSVPQAIKIAEQRYVQGAYSIFLEAGQRPAADIVSATVHTFQVYPDVYALQPRVSMETRWTMSGLIELYARLLWRKQLKADTATRTLLTPTVPFASQRKATRSSDNVRVRYAPAIQVRVPGTRPLQRYFANHQRIVYARWHQLRTVEIGITWSTVAVFCRNLLACSNACLLVCLPLALGYATYVAFAAAQPTLLFVCLGVISILSVFAVLDEPNLSVWTRIKLVFGVPLTYTGFLGLSLLYVLSTAYITGRYMISHMSWVVSNIRMEAGRFTSRP